MPELPEVETLARGLRKYIVGKTIAQPMARGKTITAVTRYGKWLVLHLSSTDNFVVHLKMTGQLLYQATQPKFLGGHTMGREHATLPNSHTRMQFVFTDGTQLFFQDQRKFGYIKLYTDKALQQYIQEKKLGYEPIDQQFTFDYFNEQLKRHGRTSIKAVLLNQSLIAGIGNIYADDICWQAKIKPMRLVKRLTVTEKKRIYQACKTILREAIRLGGTSFSHYYKVDGQVGSYWEKRKVYGRTNESCRRCGKPIQKTRCAGRGTHYCAQCQK